MTSKTTGYNLQKIRKDFGNAADYYDKNAV
jgi:hypothetical protein